MSVRTTNPALSEKTFQRFNNGGDVASTQAMTVEGTVNKTLILLLLAVLSGGYTWSQVMTPGGIGNAIPLAFGGILVGFIVAIVTIFKPNISPYTAPIYALLEGLFLGAISAVFNLAYPGIAVQAVGLTISTLLVLLIAYKAGIIRVTETFRTGIIAATGGIVLFGFISLIMSYFGASQMASLRYSSFNHSWLAIGISLFVVAIAALNLVLDFDLIERGVARRVPKFMEWYGAFSLMVTLVWLYLEILRLLARLNRR